MKLVRQARSPRGLAHVQPVQSSVTDKREAAPLAVNQHHVRRILERLAQVIPHGLVRKRIELRREHMGEARDRRLSLNREDELEILDTAAADHTSISSAARVTAKREAR